MNMYNRLGVGYCVLHHFQQYFSYIVAVSFLGGGNLVPGVLYNLI